MSNGNLKGFERMMLPRLEATARDEASEFVLYAYKHGDDLGVAVAEAIESLPTRATKRLREWTEQTEIFFDWLPFEEDGWEIVKLWRGTFAPMNGRFAVVAPEGEELEWPEESLNEDIVSAAADAGGADYVGTNKRVRPGRIAYVFHVTKTI